MIFDFLMDIDNVELILLISYIKEILEEELYDWERKSWGNYGKV